MTFEELKSLLLKHKGNGIVKWLRARGNEEILSSLIQYTPLLNDSHTLLTRIYWVINGIKEFPRCIVCGVPLMDKNISTISRGYHKICSHKCSYELAKGKNKGIPNIQRLLIEAEKRRNRKMIPKCSYTITKEGNVLLPCRLEIIGKERINKELEIHHLVYKITNKTNGHYYIGHHSTLDPLDEYSGSGVAITCAIRKYGIENFQKEILFDCTSLKESCEIEARLVTEDDCMENNPSCYNLKPGGYGGCSKRAGQKASETRRKRGYKHSSKTKMLISAANKGVPKSEHHKKMLQMNHSARRNYVIVYENGSQEVVKDSIPGIARTHGITNVSSFKNSIKRNRFYNGIRIIKL